MNEDLAEQFEMYRPLMLSIAYRMLGSFTDAEDMVQQAYLRYQARTQRETYVGEWLPEPVLTDSDDRYLPAQQAELHESLSIAFLTLLEQLTPVERAVFLLREVFDYDYAEIAGMVGKEEAACRQLLSRAKKHIAEHRPRFKPEPATHRQLLDRFIESARSGDLDGLLELLSDDVVMWADGGGKIRGAILHPLYGRDAVARFVMGSTRFTPEGAEPGIDEINGEPTFVLRANGETRIVITISVDGEHIRAVRVMGNPDKLKWVNHAAENQEAGE